MRVLAWIALPFAALFALWGAGVWWVALETPAWSRVLLLALWLLALPALLLALAGPWRTAGLALWLLLPLGVFLSIRPGRIAEYRLEQSRMPWAEIDGSRVTLHELRTFRWPSVETPRPGWVDLELDVDSLESVDYWLVYFAGFRGVAHAFLSFGFSNGEQVAVSIEARRRKGEGFGLLPGLYRRFETMIVFGDEPDLVGLRLHAQGDPVLRFAATTPPEKMRGLFLGLLERANALRERPEFYHTLLGTCTTEMAAQVNRLRQEKIPLWHWRLVLPGYSYELARGLGLLAETRPLDEALPDHLVDPTTVFGEDPREFSARLRGLVP